MNPSSALATVLVDELVRGGVRDVVLAPGSRSAPLAYAVHAADAAGRLRLHVRVDERSAGFLALGLARASGRPVPVVTTSGTAVANLHPAVLEAHHSGVPVLVVSADRPHELRGTGANQTTVQPGIFGGAVRWSTDLPAAESVPGQNAWWRSTVCRALTAATGALDGSPGPVHIDVGFREPLVPGRPGDPDEADPWPESLAGRAHGGPWVEVLPSAPALGQPGGRPHLIEHVERTMVVIGDLRGATDALVAAQWAERRGYPVVAEPLGSLSVRSHAIPHGPLLLTATEWLDQHAPDRVLVIGRLTVARPVARLLRRPGVRVEAVAGGGVDWADPGHVVTRVHPWSALAADGPGERAEGGEVASSPSEFAQTWRHAGESIADVVARQGFPWPSGLSVAATVAAALPPDASLVIGSSNPVRDLDLATAGRPAPHGGIRVFANRGLAGIDGMVSTAMGVALGGDRPAYALMGDLTFLHDANGLLIGPEEPVPDLTIVVTNDDGGGIFTLLEHGAPERAGTFERVFGTPTGTDLAALCAAHGVPHERVTSRERLAAAVAERPQGIRVIEVPVDRATHRQAHADLRAAAAQALAAS